MSLPRIREIFATTYSGWSAHNAPRLGAALAYYTLLSLAPLMILLVTICGMVFRNAAERDLLVQAQDVIGPAGAATLKGIIDNTHHAASGIFATTVAVLTLLLGASGVFMELRASLNTIWEVPPRLISGWKTAIWQRLVSFGMVAALGLLLLASLVASAVLAVVQKFARSYLPLSAAITDELLNTVVTTLAFAVLFSLIFKFVPDTRLSWRTVLPGAAVTSVLFAVGKAVLAFYLATAAVGSAYGAAGSLVALVIWVYYSAQIFFFGAVFTKRYGDFRERMPNFTDVGA